MKAYRLKDKERQRAFELALPHFVEELNRACMEQVDDETATIYVTHLHNHDFSGWMWSVIFTKDEIESCPAYDPNNWNDYPEVEPPVEVPMRLELLRLGAVMRRYAARFSDDQWRLQSGDIPIPAEGADQIRFRPWEDERHFECPEEQRKLGLLSQYLINSDPNGRNE